MTITHHPDLIQGSDEWIEARRGLITAGSLDLILTPTLKIASNAKERQHLYELLAQRVTGHVEPEYISDAMLRGLEEEVYARDLYAEKYAPVTEVGMVTNDELGFVVSCSPDALVGDDGLIEIKSRMQKYQAQTIIEGEVPTEFMLQIQGELFVTGRQWCDFISYSGGMPMFVKRVEPLEEYQFAIRQTATAFNQRLEAAIEVYEKNAAAFHQTERVERGEILL